MFLGPRMLVRSKQLARALDYESSRVCSSHTANSTTAAGVMPAMSWLMSAQCAQKLFGWFNGPGIDGTARGMEALCVGSVLASSAIRGARAQPRIDEYAAAAL